ncbi:MAG: T9SS type A sorting domain-containing protein, partial [Bacteroidetes bacterium]
VRDETFRRGFQLGGGMKIGVMKTDDARRYGWVRILKSADLYRSLYDRKTMQTGTPRGFNLFSNNGRFVGEQKVLVPSKYNNRLFAELAALKFNIEASNRGITPAGLGEIVYDEGLNPLSGMAIKDIAKRADTLMTYWYDRSPDEYMNLDTTVRKINHAFSGSIDTASYFSLLALKGVRTVSEISFLRLPADITPIIEQKKHVLEQNGEMPGSYVLYQNYPNPFNPVTTIEFALPHQSEVTLTLFDVLGREVATLVDKEILEEGIQYVDFYADGLPSGVYFYKIVAKQVSEEGETGELFIDTKKMMYVR